MDPSTDTDETGSDQIKLTHDRLGRVLTHTDPNATVHTYTYNAPGTPGSGQLASDAVTTLGTNVDGTVRRIQKSYDTRGRTTAVTSYDAASGGSVVNDVALTFSDATGSWGALTKMQQNNTGAVAGGSPAVDYAYADGAASGVARYLRVTSVTYPGPTTRRVVHYNYPTTGDGAMLGRVDNIADDSSGTTKYAQYDYFGAGSIFKVAHPAVSGGLTLSYDTTGGSAYAGLDRFGRVTHQKWTNGAGGTTFDNYEYGYDKAGNRTYRYNALSTARSELYSHDELDRLINVARGTLNGGRDAISGTPATEEAFNLDIIGNWAGYVAKVSGSTILDQARTHNLVNEIDTDNDHSNNPGAAITASTGTNWFDPKSDASGNMTQMPKVSDEGNSQKLVYDAWNRLVQVKDSGDTVIVTYRYNGLHHRVRKLLGSNPSSPTTTYDDYYNAGWQVLEQRRDSDADPYAQYIWDLRYIDAPVVRFRDSNTDGTLDDTLYPLNDANMNVTALVDASGTVQERYAYDPYGKVAIFDNAWASRASSSYDNQILYCGYRYDGETGLYHVRHRMYHPTLGRWMQRDPLGYPVEPHLYGYVSSRPLSLLDPSGEKPAPVTPQPITVTAEIDANIVADVTGYEKRSQPELKIANYKRGPLDAWGNPTKNIFDIDTHWNEYVEEADWTLGNRAPWARVDKTEDGYCCWVRYFDAEEWIRSRAERTIKIQVRITASITETNLSAIIGAGASIPLNGAPAVIAAAVSKQLSAHQINAAVSVGRQESKWFFRTFAWKLESHNERREGPMKCAKAEQIVKEFWRAQPRY